MNEIPAALLKKNKISAFCFLASAIISSLLLAFLAFVFVLIFGSINALFAGLGGKTENSFAVGDVWQLYLFFFLSVSVIISQLTAFGLIISRSRYGRIAGIVSFILTVVMFTPISLLLIYPFAFLVSNNGKYIYQNFIKN